MKLLWHLTCVFALFVVGDLLGVFFVFQSGVFGAPSATNLVPLVALIFTLLITNGPGGVIVKRFIQRHTVHAKRIEEAMRKVEIRDADLNSLNQRARRVLRLRNETPGIIMGGGDPGEFTDDRRLSEVVSHLRSAHEYRTARALFNRLEDAVRQYELAFTDGRTTVEAASDRALRDAYPNHPVEPTGGKEFVNIEAVTALVWRAILTSRPAANQVGYGDLYVGAYDSGGKNWDTVSERSPNHGNAGLFVRGSKDSARLIALVTGLLERGDLRAVAAGVNQKGAIVIDLDRQFQREAARIIERIEANEDVAGWCKNCPSFGGS